MLKVPAIIAASIISFMLGGGVAVLAVTLINPDWKTSKSTEAEQSTSATGGPGGPAGGMGPMGAAPGGGRGGPGGGGRAGGGPGGGRGGGGPSSKVQLVALVTKLEQLTSKPLSVNLNQEQQEKLREELNGLDNQDELSEDDAKKRLESILEIVKGDKETLEAAGYRWPGPRGGGAGGGQPPAEPPNPFKEENAGKHLKALRDQLSKGKPE
jgi:hypothetical protein